MGCLTTLAVLMVQGGVRDLVSGTNPMGSSGAILSTSTTIFGGGLLALPRPYPQSSPKQNDDVGIGLRCAETSTQSCPKGAMVGRCTA